MRCDAMCVYMCVRVWVQVKHDALLDVFERVLLSSLSSASSKAFITNALMKLSTRLTNETTLLYVFDPTICHAMPSTLYTYTICDYVNITYIVCTMKDKVMLCVTYNQE